MNSKPLVGTMWLAIIAGLLVVITPPSGESKAPKQDGISQLIAVTQHNAQNANDEAYRAAEKQRELVKSFTTPGGSAIGQAIGGKATESNREQSRPQTPRERTRERAVLQQLEANAKHNAAILANVQRLAAELKKLNCLPRD